MITLPKLISLFQPFTGTSSVGTGAQPKQRQTRADYLYTIIIFCHLTTGRIYDFSPSHNMGFFTTQFHSNDSPHSIPKDDRPQGKIFSSGPPVGLMLKITLNTHVGTMYLLHKNTFLTQIGSHLIYYFVYLMCQTTRVRFKTEKLITSYDEKVWGTHVRLAYRYRNRELFVKVLQISYTFKTCFS